MNHLRSISLSNPYVATFLGLLFIGGGIVHILIILGILEEKAPLLITLYFHSLAIIDIVVGVGLILQKRAIYPILLFIGYTQIIAHGYMLSLEVFTTYTSGVSYIERVGEIVFSVLLIIVTHYSLGSFSSQVK